MAAISDRSYSNLLAHLQQPKSFIPEESVLAAIPYYLSQLTLPHPTQLTAIVISSPIWRPISVRYIQSISDAYRTALHGKQNALRKQGRGWLSPSPQTVIGEWAGAILTGISRGDPFLKMCIIGGLLMGFNESDKEYVPTWVKDRLERRLVVACAEALDAIVAEQNAWHSEFTSNKELVDEALFLHCSYTFLPLVSDDKFIALDIKILTQLAQRGVNEAFIHGNFLSSLQSNVQADGYGKLIIPLDSHLYDTLETLSNKILYQHAGPLSKLLSRCLNIFADQFPGEVWDILGNITKSMETVSKSLEQSWNASSLSQNQKDENIDPTTRPTMTNIWKALKTVLFSHVMISQSILVSIKFVQPTLYSDDVDLSPSSIARSILRDLHYLSFVISQFGGIVSGAGFKELQRTFYMAIDIMVAGLEQEATDKFAIDLVQRACDTSLDQNHPSKQAQTAFTLAIIEQLVPVLGDSTIKDDIVPFCDQYLNDPNYREVYESAHSVMLSIFAANAQRKVDIGQGETSSFCEVLVPFYANTLIQNSNENRLNQSQLKLAYSNLVQNASSSGNGDGALAWLCIDTLLTHIKESPASSRVQLYLTLISLISCVSGRYLSKILEEVKVIYQNADEQCRQELGDAIVQEIMNKVGEREKATVLTWWRNVYNPNENNVVQ